MKKIIFSSLFLLAFVGLSQAQTTETATKPAPKVEAANPAVKSCCAPKADASKTSCAKDEAQVKSCCASMAEAGKKCCAKGETKAEASTGQSQTSTSTAAPEAGSVDKPQAIAAGATRSSGKTESAPAETKAVQK